MNNGYKKCCLGRCNNNNNGTCMVSMFLKDITPNNVLCAFFNYCPSSEDISKILKKNAGGNDMGKC